MTATTITTIAVTRQATPSRARILRSAAQAEWTKIRSVRSTMWTLVTTLGLAIGFGALIAATQINNWDNLDPAEKAMFDPTAFSLSGLFLAQLAIGVLGVLTVTSEYATGQIRATLAATPQRLTVLAAKSITYIVVVFAVGLAASFGAFGIGQAIFSAEHLGASLTDPGVLRAVIGGALYLTAVGLLGIGFGMIIRRTAGAITSFVGLLMIVPLVASFFPASWNDHFAKYLPANAGMALFNVKPDPTSLSPWTGLVVLLLYGAVTLAFGGLLLSRNDA